MPAEMDSLEDKLDKLKSILRDMGSVLVAYSGGTDSSLLAVTAHEVLGQKALSVFVHSPVSPTGEKEEAAALAKRFGFRFKSIETNELENPLFTANTPERCYYCKSDLFGSLKSIAGEENFDWIAEGTNADDLDDYRPGRKACAEAGVRSPLLEAGLTKEEIRKLSKQKGLPTWDKPASPCLASRIPYGTPVTQDVLSGIAAGENYLRNLGLRQLRLRHYGDTARIEVDEQDMAFVIKEEIRRDIVRYLKSLGYRYVALDLTGYRTGSLNIKILEADQKG